MEWLLAKRVSIPVGICLLVVISYGCIYAYYFVHISKKVTSAVSCLGDVNEAFWIFRDRHHRWPTTMEDVYGTETNEGSLDREYYKDPFSGLPYCCVTNEGLYHQIDTERPYQILAILPRPYRTRLWPFGEDKTIIVTSSGIRIVTPSEIVVMKHPGVRVRNDALPKSGQ